MSYVCVWGGGGCPESFRFGVLIMQPSLNLMTGPLQPAAAGCGDVLRVPWTELRFECFKSDMD